ncbi:MAG: BatA domain-containing protein [Planctomycetaceae bacterium]|nr:BatA domain-containing protein [Planctomycetaceae bacterium]
MSTWIAQHFLNPAFFWPGVALIAAPIIIHLINRLRYRKVRFAAMEFLLASQKRNRRKILIEQLLLLFMRVALIILIVALIGRLIVDPNQISVFQGAKSHHVVILDDTASMQDREGDGDLFAAAKETVRRIVAEGARRPGSQLLSLILMSAPDKTVSGLSERTIDETLLTEVTDQLESLSCSSQTADPATALESARQRLGDDRSALRTVHVLSDFRKQDWIDNKAATSLIRELDKAGIFVNLVRSVDEGHENLGVVELQGEVEVAAAGVPVSLSATVENFGSREAKDVRASIFVDDVRLPRTVDFQTISAGDKSTRRFDVVFSTAEPHTVRLSLDDDALELDNQRYLAVDVPVANPVLIIDGSPALEQALYIADALAANQSVTGYAPDLRTPEDLRRISLDRYHLIYLVNVPELAPDAVAGLEDYVRNGGGLIWYLGDAVRPAFYNEKLFTAEGSLFPVQLGLAPETLSREANATVTADLIPNDHPLFDVLAGGEVPLLDLVFVNLFYPVKGAAESPAVSKDVRTVAELRTGNPVMFEHRLGNGQIFTCLTAAGPLMNPEGVIWTNWANGPGSFSFVVFQLELAKRMIRTDRAFPQLATGSPLEVEFNQTEYLPDVEVETPDQQITRIQASRPESVDAGTPQTALELTYGETNQPGVYSFTLSSQEGTQKQRLFALNVPAQEGNLDVAADEPLFRELGEAENVSIQPAGSFEWIRSESPGSEMRWMLLVGLAALSLFEQLLASRLSYVD